MTRKPPVPDNPALLMRHAMRRDFALFARKAWPYVSGGEDLEWNWHHDAIVHQLNQVRNGKVRRLIINLQPRSGKSKLISVLHPAWRLGLEPNRQFVGVSYSNELSGKMARDCRSIIEQPFYREIFPNTVISRSRSAALDFETTRGGGKLSTSTGGSLTGRGGSVIILDDVIKPEEAFSELARTRLNDWFRTTLTSRLDNKRTGAIVVVMQRLHEYDLSGMLIEKGGWDVLALPAIAYEPARIALTRGRCQERNAGDILHPEREPLEVLEEIRNEMGADPFEAQYQQRPAPAEGNLYKAKWLRTWLPGSGIAAGGQVVQSWDTGIKTGPENAYSVCITARITGREVYIIDVWRGRLEFYDLERKVVELASLHEAHAVLIEDKGSGQELIQNLRAKNVPGIPLPIPRIPTTDKRDRAAGVSSMVEAGHLFVPQEARWLAEFRNELLTFPSSRFDDQVDALTQLLAWVRERALLATPANAGPELHADDESGHGGGAECDEDDYRSSDIDAVIDAWGA